MGLKLSSRRLIPAERFLDISNDLLISIRISNTGKMISELLVGLSEEDPCGLQRQYQEWEVT